MSWPWILVTALVVIGLTQLLQTIERHAKRATEALVSIEVTLEHLQDTTARLEGDVAAIRRDVVPRADA